MEIHSPTSMCSCTNGQDRGAVWSHANAEVQRQSKVCIQARALVYIVAFQAYQVSSELQQDFLPLIRSQLVVDLLCEKLETCLKSAASSTMPQACKRHEVHSRTHQPWFELSCKEALVCMNAV